MCGIIYVKGPNAARKVFKRYNHQKHRGSDGFGFVSIGQKAEVIRTETETAIRAYLDEAGDEIIFHHRYPTSTDNVAEVNHPILVSDKRFKRRYYVVHNGVIKNAAELKKSHEKSGLKYRTEIEARTVWKIGKTRRESAPDIRFNDSEAFAVDLALTLSGQQEKLKSDGSIAFIALETDKKGKPLKLHYGRNSNPLVLEKAKDFMALKSEGNGEAIKPNTLYSYDYLTEETSEMPFHIGPEAKPIIGYAYGGYSRDWSDWKDYQKPVAAKNVEAELWARLDEIEEELALAKEELEEMKEYNQQDDAWYMSDEVERLEKERADIEKAIYQETYELDRKR